MQASDYKIQNDNTFMYYIMKNPSMLAICNDTAIPVFLTDEFFLSCVFFSHSAGKSGTHLP